MTNNTLKKSPLSVILLIILAVLIPITATSCKKQTREDNQGAKAPEINESENISKPQAPEPVTPPDKPEKKEITENVNKPKEQEPAEKTPQPNPAENKAIERPTVDQIVKASNGRLNKIFTGLYGKPAPDFELTDINDKKHKLSDYKGTHVMIVLWATWCPPCKYEIPELIELRERTSKEQLTILAISNEKTSTVKNFTEREKLNYTILLNQGELPKAYNPDYLPSSVYINPKGIVKVGIEGVTQLNEMIGFLNAPK